MIELLKRCAEMLSNVIELPRIHHAEFAALRHDLARAIAAEEKRKPDAWMHKSTLDVIPAWCHHGDKEEWYTRPLYRSIAPPQVPDGASVGANVEQPHAITATEVSTPADGAAQCPRCGSRNKPFVSSSCALNRHHWHDSTPAAD